MNATMDSMDLNEMLVFVEVVNARSFTGAARALQMPKSSVSRKVSHLEDRLKAQLLHRTTRKIALTDVGEEYYRICRAIVADAKAADQRVAEMSATPCGRLRVTAPPTFAFLGPILAEYLTRYPEVSVELVCTERVVDLLAEGFDVAVRAGRLADSSLITRKLGTLRRLLVAAPDYLERFGTPRGPEALPRHAAVLFGGGHEGHLWRLRSNRKSVDVRPIPRLVVDDYDMLLESTLSGLGIALIPNYVCRQAIEDETLVRVLPAWSGPEIPVHAVYPARRQPPVKLTALLDLLRDRFKVGHPGRGRPAGA